MFMLHRFESHLGLNPTHVLFPRGNVPPHGDEIKFHTTVSLLQNTLYVKNPKGFSGGCLVSARTRSLEGGGECNTNIEDAYI